MPANGFPSSLKRQPNAALDRASRTRAAGRPVGPAAPTMSRHRIRVGLISDTHGQLRAEAMAALRGSDFIVHAGDIGHAGIIDQLAEIAPVIAVRGNNDRGAWSAGLREAEVLNVDAVVIYVIHDLARLRLDPVAAGFQVVVSGHSHRPGFDDRDGVLYVNPGSAGPRRFTLPVSVGELTVSGVDVTPRLLTLSVRGAA